jgi:hypothetical protein
MVLSLTVTVAPPMAMPAPVSATLPLTVLCSIVAVPETDIPPPTSALLALTVLPLSVREPL